MHFPHVHLALIVIAGYGFTCQAQFRVLRCAERRRGELVLVG